AGARADALASACAADDPVSAAAAANTLVGLGPGLTPAGDDFTGGAFFARAVLARARVVDPAAREAAAPGVLTAAAPAPPPAGGRPQPSRAAVAWVGCSWGGGGGGAAARSGGGAGRGRPPARGRRGPPIDAAGPFLGLGPPRRLHRWSARLTAPDVARARFEE